MKKVGLLLAVVVVLGLFTACAAPVASSQAPAENSGAPAESSAPVGSSAAPAEGAIGTIGVVFDFLQVERRVLAKNYLEQYAKEANVELIFMDANGDEEV